MRKNSVLLLKDLLAQISAAANGPTSAIGGPCASPPALGCAAAAGSLFRKRWVFAHRFRRCVLPARPIWRRVTGFRGFRRRSLAPLRSRPAPVAPAGAAPLRHVGGSAGALRLRGAVRPPLARPCCRRAICLFGPASGPLPFGRRGRARAGIRASGGRGSGGSGRSLAPLRSRPAPVSASGAQRTGYPQN